MKKVFATSEQVLHVWASGRQESARCRNVFFNSPERVYSYGHHYCLAARIASDTVAINRRVASVTTSKHQHQVKRATSHMKQLLVFDPESPEEARKRLGWFVDEMLEKASKARSRRASYLLQAADAIRDHNTFCDLLRARKHKHPQLDVDGWTPAQWEEAKAKAEAAEERKAKAAERRRKKEAAQRIADWRAGGGSYGLGHLPAMLRLSPDRSKVQTSHHAEVPVEDAIRAWPLIRRAVREKKEYVLAPSSETHLGLFRLSRVEEDGTIVVGCHRIGFAEVRGIAEELQLEGV